eukprot:TRINITY_DN36492_c0_g1_i1.p1 TRINITY_DN36492_c0_g1~~TRINITY_DN36492_c0_g1_i1.p1  ORF type:complete len:624 (+),score=65.23 TRINITY_DN36492_c0_g1_i1:61-1932(+)
MAGAAPAKIGTCSKCGLEFPTRGLLFRHLRGESAAPPCTAGITAPPAPPKPTKIAMLIGYCTSSGEEASRAAHEIARVVSTVKAAEPPPAKPPSAEELKQAPAPPDGQHGTDEAEDRDFHSYVVQDLGDVPPADFFAPERDVENGKALAGFTHGVAGGVCAANAVGDVVTVDVLARTVEGIVDVEALMSAATPFLPAGAHIFAIAQMPRIFNAERLTTARRHQYLLPTQALLGKGEILPSLQGPQGHSCMSELLARLKSVLHRFRGTHYYHNFIGGTAQPNDSRCFVKRCNHFGQFTLQGESFVGISMLSKLRGEQFCRVTAMAVAVMRGLLPVEIIDFALGARAILDVPPASPSACLVSELHFHPGDGMLEYRPGLFPECAALRTRILSRIADEEVRGRAIFRWAHEDLARWAEGALERFRALSALECRPLAPPQASPPPEAYQDVLKLLRKTVHDGSWPPTSTGRKLVIGEHSLNDTGTCGSFTAGFLSREHVPEANSTHPELVDAIFELERTIAPHRQCSSAVAINCRAAFLPHKDSGAGAGQSKSLIVALGDFTGGELLVEGVMHNVHYTPLEFDGWTHRHWTAPFLGERFSLVYFTPCGCEDHGWFQHKRNIQLPVCE